MAYTGGAGKLPNPSSADKPGAKPDGGKPPVGGEGGDKPDGDKPGKGKDDPSKEPKELTKKEADKKQADEKAAEKKKEADRSKTPPPKGKKKVLAVKSVNRLQGITAAEFDDTKKAKFKAALEKALTVKAEVKDIVATDVLSRRLSVGRSLLASTIDVSYTLELEVEEGASVAETFTALTDDVQTSIKDTDALKDAIVAEMGNDIVLDKAAYEVNPSLPSLR